MSASFYIWPEGAGGGKENYLLTSYMGMLCPEIQLLTLFDIPFLKVKVPLLLNLLLTIGRTSFTYLDYNVAFPLTANNINELVVFKI